MASHIWFFYSLSAAILWGIGYVLSEKIMNDGMTPAFLMFVSALVCFPLYFTIASYMGELRTGFSHLFSSWKMATLVLIMAFTVVGGNFLILSSINEKNATLASLIEITYPLFTFVFAWLILKDVQLSWASGFGALLIFSGIAVIYFKS